MVKKETNGRKDAEDAPATWNGIMMLPDLLLPTPIVGIVVLYARDDSQGRKFVPFRIFVGLSTSGSGGSCLSKLDLATILIPGLFGLKSFIGVTGLRSPSFAGVIGRSSLSRLRPLLPPRLEDSPSSSTTGSVCPC